YELGNVIHKALDDLYTKVEVSLIDYNKLEKILEKSTGDSPFLILDLEIFKRKLKEFIEYEKERFDKNIQVIACEKSFNFLYNGIRLKGTIDRIDKLNEEYHVIDYKTSSSLKVDMLKNFESSSDFQLEFYYLACKEFFKYKDIKTFYYDLYEVKLKEEIALIEKLDLLDKIFEEMQAVKNTANKTSKESSKEMMALLKLSEYQSNIRMHAESKYGDAKDLESMATQTAEIINLFDKLSIEAGEKIPLPHEVRQWAVSKILDCADKWEIRFSDIFTILTNAIGKELLKESIRIQQIRDIYGIRAVDEIRTELNIS
ncbi:MAG: RecB family exonuclease, partial [Nitrosarchaeum sp.]